MKSAIFLSIREKAKRLPHKVLREVNGRTMTEHLIARLKLARGPDRVIMTTSTHGDDDVLCALAEREGIGCFRGSEEDKLVRYRDAARALDVGFMVIVDGDDLFCSEQHIDEAVETFQRTGADYISQEGLPLGAASFGVKREAIERVCELKAERDTEVWGAYFTGTGLFNVNIVQIEDPLMRKPAWRMTLDYEEDLRFFTAVIQALYPREGPPPPFRAVMEYLERHPEVVALNASAQAKYEAHLQQSAAARLRSEDRL